MSLMEEQSDSDDEIFMGKVTLKQMKKIFGARNYPGLYSENRASHNIKMEPNTSINIIETHSQPNLRLVKEEKATFFSNPGSPAFNRSADDSFIKLENQVSELCVAPRTSDNVELNNTLEVIDYILNNGPKQKTEHTTLTKDEKLLKSSEKLLSIIQENSKNDEEKKKPLSTHYTLKEIGPIEKEKTPHKDIKIKHHNIEQIQVDFKDSEQYFTPVQSEKKIVFATPSSRSLKLKQHVLKTPATPSSGSQKLKPPVLKTPATPSSGSQKLKPPVLKTPATPSSGSQKLKPPVHKTLAPLSNKKTVTSAKKTPNKTNAYHHIASPIAFYINNCPRVPLVKNVLPKKPLPGPSSIPKYVKSIPITSQNKENIDLPKVAYKNAKTTVLINVDEEKLPQSNWVKSTLPRPTVVKHQKREMNPLKTLKAKQEESFANLSCLQAEVSVCTEKTAFKLNK